MRPLTGHPWLDKTAVVSYPGGFGTAADGSQYPSSTATATVMCTVQPDNSAEAMDYMRLTGKIRALGIFDPLNSVGAAIAIPKDSTLVITDADGTTVRRYRAMGAHMHPAGMNVCVTVPLEENS